MRVLRMGQTDAMWFLGALAPLGVGWVAAFGVTAPAHVGSVVAIGVIAFAGAIGLGFALWRLTMHSAHRDETTRLRRVGLVSAVVVATLGWVWLQYALNPFRVLSVFDAMSMSRSLPWQLTAGVCVFSGFVFAAQMVRLRERVRSLSVVETREPVSRLEHLSIRIGTRTVLVRLENVERLQGCDDHVAVYVGGKRMLASYRLRDLERQLDASKFMRVHRSHIVNVAFIQRVERVDPNRDVVVMRSGERVAASRAGSAGLRKLLRIGASATVEPR